MSKRCIKCSGYVLYGGTRFGQSVKDVATCANCGLGSESESYYDAHMDIYRSMRGPHVVVQRDRSGG
jgi:hypothetical protein